MDEQDAHQRSLPSELLPDNNGGGGGAPASYNLGKITIFFLQQLPKLDWYFCQLAILGLRTRKHPRAA